MRVASALLPDGALDEQSLQQFYFLTDFALLAGISAIYGSSAARIGAAGLIGSAIFLFGILMVRSSSVSFFGAHGYRAGAALALIGVTLLGAAMLLRRVSRAAPLLWFAALVVGVAGTAVAARPMLIAASGILFGLGFVAGGVGLLRRPNEKEGHTEAA